MSAAAHEYFYYPFQADWHADRRWRRQLWQNPVLIRRSIQGLRTHVLTDRAIFGHNWAGHPLAVEYAQHAGRWRMLEMGAVLVRLRRVNQKDLLDPAKHLQAAAELRAILLLTRMGLKVRREPSNRGVRPQKRIKGPDLQYFHADGISGGVEVKCPKESSSTLGRIRLVTHIVWRTHELVRHGVNIALNPKTIADSVRGDWADTRRADSLLLDALVASEDAGTSQTALGRVEPAPSEFSSMIGPIPVDEEDEAERLRSTLEDAAGQLQNWSPGIIVIDTSADPDLMRRCCCIAALMREEWASELAMVMLVKTTCPGFVVTIVPGPRFESGPKLSGRVCSNCHIHVDTFARGGECTVDKRFDDFPGFCTGHGH